MKMNKKAVIDTIAKFYEIEETQGTNAKKDILRKYVGDTEFTNTLRWYFDNLIVTGLRRTKVDKVLGKGLGFSEDEMNEMKTWSLSEFLEHFEVNNTGKDIEALRVQYWAGLFDHKTREGIIRLVTKSWDKGLGIGRTICNNVYGDIFLPTHDVMLCQNYFDNPDHFVDARFAIQVKLDGFRMTIFKNGDRISVLSRSGKDQTGKFPLIEDEVRKTFKGLDVVLDGERMPVGFMSMDSKQQYKLVAESTRKGGSNEVCLAVYDFMMLKDWNNRNCKWTYSERYANYMSHIGKKGKYLFPLPALYIGDDVGEIENWLDWAKANDKEGVIVKDMDAHYEWDRSAACAKVKSFKDIDLEITGYEEGKGRHRNRLGAIRVDYKGNSVKVGTGFSDEMRDYVWKNRDKLLGQTVEIVYFEASQNKSGGESLRFPVFKSFKADER